MSGYEHPDDQCKILLIKSRNMKQRTAAIRSLRLSSGWQKIYKYFNDWSFRIWQYKLSLLSCYLISLDSVSLVRNKFASREHSFILLGTWDRYFQNSRHFLVLINPVVWHNKSDQIPGWSSLIFQPGKPGQSRRIV